MGDAKRREYQRLLQAAERELCDRGRLIEAGWLGLRSVWLPPDTPENQVLDLRMAFMAGAQHLFTSIMTVLEPGDDPTPSDWGRLEKIAGELERFEVEMRMSLPTEGRA